MSTTHIAAIALLVLTGCAATEVVPEVEACTLPSRADVFRAGPPDHAFVEVGVLHGRPASEDESILSMRHKAADVGLDAIWAIDCTNSERSGCSAKGAIYVRGEIACDAVYVTSPPPSLEAVSLGGVASGALESAPR